MKRLVALWLCTCSALLAQGTLTLEQISTDQGIWPTEVMVVVDHKVPVEENGKTRFRKRGPGKTYTLVSINAKEVTIDCDGKPLTFKADETDVIARAEQMKALRSAPPAPAAAAPAPPPAQTAPMDPPNSGPQMVAVDSISGASASNPAGSTQSGAGSNVMARKLQGMLVRMNNGKLEPYDSDKLNDKKYLAVYFSASWCGPCRRFTPSLVQWYSQAKAALGDFEIIFVSSDEDEDSMKSYMLGDHMEWPAVAFNLRGNNPLAKYSGRGIPNMVVLDSSGAVVSASYEGDKYVGPGKPLQEMQKLLSQR